MRHRSCTGFGTTVGRGPPREEHMNRCANAGARLVHPAGRPPRRPSWPGCPAPASRGGDRVPTDEDDRRDRSVQSEEAGAPTIPVSAGPRCAGALDAPDGGTRAHGEGDVPDQMSTYPAEEWLERLRRLPTWKGGAGCGPLRGPPRQPPRTRDRPPGDGDDRHRKKSGIAVFSGSGLHPGDCRVERGLGGE